MSAPQDVRRHSPVRRRHHGHRALVHILCATLVSLVACNDVTAVTPQPGHFLIYRGCIDERCGLIRANSDGASPRLLVPADDYFMCPSPAPDGSAITYERFSSRRVFVFDLVQQRERALLPEGTIGQCPSWSPDGSRIVFHRYVEPSESGLYVMNADGSNVRLLASGTFLIAPTAWSPDGRSLAVARGDIGRLTILDAFTGATLRQLDATGRGASWSPDGTRLVFTRQIFGGTGLFLIDADGRNERPFLVPPETISSPSFAEAMWSPDGRYIVFKRDGDAVSNQDPPTVTAATLDGRERPWKARRRLEGDQPFWIRAR